jgi:hypothetical protein
MYEYLIILILSPVEFHLRFGGTYCLHIHDRTVSQASNQQEVGDKQSQIQFLSFLLPGLKGKEFYTDRICDQIKSNRIVKVISSAPYCPPVIRP